MSDGRDAPRAADATVARRWPRADVDLGRALSILAAVAFWGWLGARWFNDWVLSRLGVGPGRRGHFLDPASVEAVAAGLTDAAGAFGPLAGAVDWLARLVGGIAVAVDVAPAVGAAVWFTILLTVAAMALGLVIAVPLAVLRVYGGPLRWVALSYTELIRGTPLLAQLFVLYFGLPLAVWLHGLDAVGSGPIPDQAFWIAIVGFTINSSAYQAEYIRGAIESVEEGQLRAARSIGLSQLEGIRYVVLPQTLRYAIPAWTNELVYLIKYSSLAAFVTVPELYYVATRIASRTFAYAPIFGLVAATYLGLVLTATHLVGRVERRVAIPGLGQVSGRAQGQTA